YYRELGRKKLAESPDDPRGYFELGAEALEQLGDATEALPLLQRACELAPRFWLAWFYRGQAHLRLGQAREALQAFAVAREGGLTGTYCAAATGEAHYALGEYESAARSFRRGLKMQPESATLASHLAMCEIRGGEAEAGLKRMRRAVRAEPENWAIQDRLISALAWLGQITAAAEAAEAALARYPEPNAKAYLRAASLRARAEQWAQAAAVLRPGIQRFPENAALRAACSQVQAHLSPPLSEKPRLEG
ncbi:MAG: tetratricopeptide repeat protein, partial [Terriglobales bacterium]